MLRKKLEEMTHVDDVSRHPALLAILTRECPNTVIVLNSVHPIRRYTCVMHVFDFADKPDYAAIATSGLGKIFAAGDFVHWLLDHDHLVEVAQSEARADDIALYFSEAGRFKHAGRTLEDGRIVSKWGIGHLYEHEVLEVPESYGNSVRFFRGLSYEEAFERFLRFAEEKGATF